MIDGARKLLAGILLLGALFGLLPLLPHAYGFYSATVTNGTSGTFFPTATTTPTSQFVTCSQWQSTYTLKRNIPHTGNMVQCTNNWNSSISLSVTLVNGNGVVAAFTPGTATIAPGASACVSVSLTTVDSNKGPNTVVYRATVNAGNPSATVYAEIDFTGLVKSVSSNPAPTYCL